MERKREEPRDEEIKNGGEEEEVEIKKTKREKTQSITTSLEASSKNSAGVPFGIMQLVVGDRKKKFLKQEIEARNVQELGMSKNRNLMTLTSKKLNRNEDKNLAGTIRGINSEFLGGKGEISKLQNFEILKI